VVRQIVASRVRDTVDCPAEVETGDAALDPGLIDPTFHHPQGESRMNKLLTVLAAAALLSAAPAFAADTKATNPQQEKMKACNAQAGDKKGDERKAFMKTCLSNAPAKSMTQGEKMSMCNKKTAGLKGEERSKAQSECMKGA
jgi:hypothetical protein